MIFDDVEREEQPMLYAYIFRNGGTQRSTDEGVLDAFKFRDAPALATTPAPAPTASDSTAEAPAGPPRQEPG